MIKRIVAIFLLMVLLLCGSAGAASEKQTIDVYYGISIKVNGKLQTLKDVNGNTVRPFALNGTTYVPLRGVATLLGCDVDYDEQSNTALIDTPAAETPAEDTITLSVSYINAYNYCVDCYYLSNEITAQLEAMYDSAANPDDYTSSQLTLLSESAEKHYQEIAARLSAMIVRFEKINTSESYYGSITQMAENLNDAMYNYKQAYDVYRGGVFTTVFVNKLQTYMIDGTYNTTIISNISTRLIDELELD